MGFYVAIRRAGVFLKLGVLGVDHAMFMDFGRRWLEGRTIYLPYQLAGPYAYDIGSGTMDVATMPASATSYRGPKLTAIARLPGAPVVNNPLPGSLAYTKHRSLQRFGNVDMASDARDANLAEHRRQPVGSFFISTCG